MKFNAEQHRRMSRRLHRKAQTRKATRRQETLKLARAFLALAKLAQAASVIAAQPLSITLRYLQTLTEIAAEKNSTIVFPLPIELLELLKASVRSD